MSEQNPFRRRGRFSLALAALLALAACSGSEKQAAPVPSSLTVVSGSGQSGVVGTLLSAALVVEVRDDSGQPMAGFTVSWGVTAGGGSVGSASSTTGPDGRASTTWTLGGTLGAQGASASGGAGLTGSFTATGTAAPATQVAVTGETSLSALQATSQLTGQLQDAFGNPVAGDVIWSTSDAAVATVSTAGLVTSVSNGSATITATAGALTGTATVTVAQIAATLAMAPAAPVATVGGTVQVTVSGLDANGFEVAVTGTTFSSASTNIATVSATGLITAIASGTSVITATAGAASGTVTMTVTDAPFEPNGDMTVDGDLAAERITIPTGVTVTLTAGATLSSATTLSVAGTIVGDCVPATLVAGTDLTVTGSITTSCSDTTQSGGDLVLRAGGAITTQRARFISGGAVLVTNVSASASGRALRSLASNVAEEEGCYHEFPVSFAGSGGSGGSGTVGGPGEPGKDIVFECRGELKLGGGQLIPGGGGNGGEGSALSGGTGIGGPGGPGGRVIFRAPSLLFRRATDLGAPPTGLTNSTQLYLGKGGRGGTGRGGGVDGSAIGGRGGDAGLPRITATSGAIVLEGGVGSPTVMISRRESQHGGDGGGAGVVASDGADATASEAAKPGGSATGQGGRGGNIGEDERTDLLGHVFVGSVTNPGAILIEDSDGRAGAGGGVGLASGNGGAGNEAFPNGADAGPGSATVGEAGSVTFFDNRSGMYVGRGGLAGGIFLGDYGLARKGSGGAGWSDCRVGNLVPGGLGGSGATVLGTAGLPGMVGGVRSAGQGSVTLVKQWGNGADGGDGLAPGMGGAAGDYLFANPVTLYTLGAGPRLQPGQPGNACEVGVQPSVAVESDENGHAPFIGFGALGQLAVTLGTGGTLTITGPAPWVTLTGTVAADGSFTLSGSGTVAGFPGVGITMTGMLTLDDESRVVGISNSTLTVDATNSVLPPDGDGNRHPAIYSVTGSKIGGQ